MSSKTDVYCNKISGAVLLFTILSFSESASSNTRLLSDAIRVSPSNHIAKVGSSFTFSCIIRLSLYTITDLDYKIRWNVRFANSTNYLLEENVNNSFYIQPDDTQFGLDNVTVKLDIKNVSENVFGWYSCRFHPLLPGKQTLTSREVRLQGEVLLSNASVSNKFTFNVSDNSTLDSTTRKFMANNSTVTRRCYQTCNMLEKDRNVSLQEIGEIHVSCLLEVRGRGNNRIRISSFNDAPSAPSKPRAVELALNNTIILLWWQPGAKTISSTINRYQLEHRHSTQTKWQLTKDFPLELSFCFLSLQVGISYWFRVKALSQTGSSNWSETSDRIYMTKSNGCHQLPKDDCSLKDQTGDDITIVSVAAVAAGLGSYLFGFIITWICCRMCFSNGSKKVDSDNTIDMYVPDEPDYEIVEDTLSPAADRLTSQTSFSRLCDLKLKDSVAYGIGNSTSATTS
ncbi:uncharacterized protein LOC134190655 [Corticium candelabrum]|uniref:uncharacterized protein LOC134190655 n=1 Tax=Corticium candelabrum TaxID=121492 RepID=UPI002E26B226|nr:uncharacterized protein LOC134190655 [Corticium candelabrum]